MSKRTTILGIDPGTNQMGYAILHAEGDELVCERTGVMKMKKYNTHQEKLKHIFLRIRELMKNYTPHEVAIEAPFYGKNVQSMLKLGRAQGVAIAAAMISDCPVSEYSPKKVKLAITGNGNASKEQVQALLHQQIVSPLEIGQFDESDALAVALCHHYQLQSPIPLGGQSSSWSDFIKLNPDRIL